MTPVQISGWTSSVFEQILPYWQLRRQGDVIKHEGVANTDAYVDSLFVIRLSKLVDFEDLDERLVGQFGNVIFTLNKYNLLGLILEGFLS